MTPTQPLDIGKLKERYSDWLFAHEDAEIGAELMLSFGSLILMAERVERLECALSPIVDRLTESEASFTKADELIGGPITDADGVFVSIGELRAARNALSPTTTEDQHG